MPKIEAKFAEVREQTRNAPDVAWYFVKGGMSLHTAQMVFRAGANLAIFRIQWDSETQKTFLARFKRGPGGLWNWVELRRREDRTRAMRTMSDQDRQHVENLLG